MPSKPRDAPKAAQHGPTRADQVACIRLALELQGVKQRELSRRSGISRSGINLHLNSSKSKRLIVPYYLRKYEPALGLPDFMLDRADRGEVLAYLKAVAHRASVGQSGLSARALEGLTSTLAFVRGQLEGFKRQGKPSVPVAQVELWLGELDAATGTVDPRKSIEAADLAKRAGQTAAAPSLRPPGRTG